MIRYNLTRQHHILGKRVECYDEKPLTLENVIVPIRTRGAEKTNEQMKLDINHGLAITLNPGLHACV